MDKSTLDKALALDIRIHALKTAFSRLVGQLGEVDAPEKIDVQPLSSSDRREAIQMLMDYVSRAEDRANAEFAALQPPAEDSSK